ncbi:asparagine--tRNA ligase, cytoplasmic 1-like protein [Tanacetum coccineum]
MKEPLSGGLRGNERTSEWWTQRRIRVKDIVKEVKDYLKTYSSAEIDISWRETQYLLKARQNVILVVCTKYESCLALRYEVLVMRELNSVSDHQMHVLYEEWFTFVEHALENRFYVIARKVIDSLRSIEVLEEVVSKGHEFEKKVKWGIDLASKHERYLIEKKFETPVIVYNYPKWIKGFYMKVNPDLITVAAIDVLVPKDAYIGLCHRVAEKEGKRKSSKFYIVQCVDFQEIIHIGSRKDKVTTFVP